MIGRESPWFVDDLPEVLRQGETAHEEDCSDRDFSDDQSAEQTLRGPIERRAATDRSQRTPQISPGGAPCRQQSKTDTDQQHRAGRKREDGPVKPHSVIELADGAASGVGAFGTQSYERRGEPAGDEQSEDG